MLILAGPDAPAAEPLPFRTGILPILTKAGCNTGACHGAATGQGGFKLSLLGYDPEEDHDRITRELGGRRLDLPHPLESLFLRKASEQVDHKGGRKLRADAPGYEAVRAWIAAGAPYGPRDLQVTGLDVEPKDSLLPDVNRAQALHVVATLSDGSRQDVSNLALYTSNDDAIAEVSKAGEVTTRGRGLTSIMVRYSGQVAAARIAVPFSGPAPNAFPPQNFIDEPIGEELRRLKLPASPLSTDAEFLRRVYLDMIGRLPTSEEARAFAKEPGTAERRRQVIDALLERDEFVDYWTMHLADLLLLGGGKGTNEAGTRAYHDWLRQQVARRTPLDQIVRELLTSTGDTTRSGAPNFFLLSSDPRDLAEQVGRMFLGTQIGCARCHAHPSDRWTQEDYHRFAAYFARVGRTGNRIAVSERGEVMHPKTGQVLSPKPLGAPAHDTVAEGDRRAPMAAWLTAPDNPLFARSLVNRVWKHLLGRGLVEPVDDLRPTNPATHPALLDALAADFSSHGFDLRHLVRTIASSRVYQLSSAALPENRGDDRLYARAYMRSLPAQVFVDTVSQVTGVPGQFPDHPPGTRAVQLIGAHTPSFALDVLGRCSRERACDSPAPGGGGLARTLHLLNGETIQAKLRGGIIDEWIAKQTPDAEVVSDLYLRALTRPPNAAENAEWLALFHDTRDRREAMEDLLWTLLNSREFGFNH